MNNNPTLDFILRIFSFACSLGFLVMGAGVVVGLIGIVGRLFA